MMHCGKLLISLLGALLASGSAQAMSAEAASHPYQTIPKRNAFALKPPAPPETNLPPVLLPRITLVGLIITLGDKRALLNVQFPAKPSEPASEQSFLLSVGQRNGPIELLEIDENAGSVRLINSGTPVVVAFDRSSPANPLLPRMGAN